MNLDELINSLQSPNNTMVNNLFGQMNLATQGGLADLENVSGSRGWGSRSGVKAGAAADIIGQSREGFAQGMSALEAQRMQTLASVLVEKQRQEAEERASKLGFFGDIFGALGTGIGGLLAGPAGAGLMGAIQSIFKSNPTN